MNNLTEQEYIHIKVRIGNLISSDVFPTKVIRNKDIPTFNQKLDEVMNYIEFLIKEHFNPSTQAVASQQLANKDFPVQSVSPKEKINVPECQDCGDELMSDEDNERKDLRCSECWAKLDEERNLED